MWTPLVTHPFVPQVAAALSFFSRLVPAGWQLAAMRSRGNDAARTARKGRMLHDIVSRQTRRSMWGEWAIAAVIGSAIILLGLALGMLYIYFFSTPLR